jgi:5-methyltetrahydrofolate--homocysteine methyltransferase
LAAAVIALTIDEVGMAKKPEDKLRIAKRLYEFAKAHGVPASDLLIDPLTFTIATGNSDDRKLGLWTLEGMELIAKELPDVQILLGTVQYLVWPHRRRRAMCLTRCSSIMRKSVA